MDPLTPSSARGVRFLRPIVPLLTAGLAGLLAAVWRLLTFGGFSNDHYIHVARAQQMLRGDWPVRDFVDPGSPLFYVASAAARLLFGEALRSEFILMAAGFAVGAAGTAWCALRLTRSLPITALVVVLEIAASPRTYNWPKMLLYGLAGCVVHGVASNPSRRRVLSAAVLTAVAFLMRHDHGIYIGAACAVTILVRGGRPRHVAASLGWFALGSGAVLAPWAVAVQMVEGLVPYFRTGLEVSRREADITLLRHWPSFDPSAGPMASGNAQAWLYYLFLALPVASLAAAWWRRRSAPEECAAVTGLVVLALAVHRGFIRDPLLGRLPDVIVPASLLGAWALGAIWRQPRRIASTVARGASVALLVLTTLAIWIVGDVRDKLDDAGLLDGPAAVLSTVRDTVGELDQRQVDVPRTPTGVSAALVPFFRYLDRCTSPDDRLLVNGSYADVFIAADRGFAGGEVTYLQGFLNSEMDQRLILDRLRAQSVPFVLRVASADPVFAADFGRVAAYISEHYRPMADVPVGTDDTVHILVEASRTAPVTDGITGWPCFEPYAAEP